MKNLQALIAVVFMISCASTQKTVQDTVKAVKSCEYLESYADDIADALNAKDFNLALNIAGEAYMASLRSEPETTVSGTEEQEKLPCLEAAKNLTRAVDAFIIENAKDK